MNREREANKMDLSEGGLASCGVKVGRRNRREDVSIKQPKTLGGG